MPSRDRHISQAEKNEEFYRQFDLNSGRFLDWAVTALFYAALHYTDAHLATQQIHPDNHVERNYRIANESSLSGLHSHYRRLQERSVAARYKIIQFSTQRVLDLEHNEFVPVKQHIRNLLSLSP